MKIKQMASSSSKVYNRLTTRIVRRQRSSPRGNQIKIATLSVRSRSRSLGKKLWYGVKGLVTRNTREI